MSTLPRVTCSSHTHIRPYMDLLMHIVLMQDTWQLHHLLPSLKDICCLKPTRWLTPLVCLLWICYNVLLRVQTSLWWSPGDHPAWTDPLPEESLSLHQVFSQFIQQVNILCPSLHVGWKAYLCLEQYKEWVYVQCVCVQCCSMHVYMWFQYSLCVCVCMFVYLCVCVCVCLLLL